MQYFYDNFKLMMLIINYVSKDLRYIMLDLFGRTDVL